MVVFAEPTDKYELIIAGATVIDGTGKAPIKNTVIYVKSGLIERIDVVKDEKYPSGRNVFSAQGKYVIPGLIDAHTHIDNGAGIDLTDEQKRLELSYNPRAFLYHGVTTVINMSARNSDFVLALKKRILADPSVLLPRVFTGSSPFTAYGGWGSKHRGVRSLSEIENRIRDYKTRGFDLVKIIIEDGLDETVFKVIETEYIFEVMRVSREYELPVFIHATDEDEHEKAIIAHPRAIVHGLVTPLEKSSKVIDDIVNNGIFVVPTIVLFEAFATFRENSGIFNDPYLKASIPDFVFREINNNDYVAEAAERHINELLRLNIVEWSKKAVEHLKVNTRLMAENGVRLAIGTDAGRAETHSFQGYNTPREMEILADCCLSPMETIVAATKNGADIIGQGDRFGTIEPGKEADFLILNTDPLQDIGNVRDFDNLVLRGRLISRDALSFEAYTRENPSFAFD